jgi:hypothetical protein
MRTILSAMVMTICIAAPAFAGDVEPVNACGDTKKADWISQDEVKAKAAALGLEVRGIKEEGGCYEIAAIDKDGKKVDEVMNPVTGELVVTEAAQ